MTVPAFPAPDEIVEDIRMQIGAVGPPALLPQVVAVREQLGTAGRFGPVPGDDKEFIPLPEGRATMRAEGRKLPITFSGQLLANENGRLKIDAMSQDRRLRGPMWVTIGPKQRLESIALEATDGQERLTLSWQRR